MSTRFAREDFRKSSYSDPDKDCVEVARRSGHVVMRDSKTRFDSPADARVLVTTAGFAALLAAVPSIRSTA